MALIAGKPEAAAPPRPLHVTDVFPFTGDRESPAIIAACERGTVVHDLCERIDRGEEVVVPTAYLLYVEAWRKFLRESGAEMVEIELAVGGPAVGYVGRLDRVARIGRSLWVIDLKTGPSWPTHGPQTAAYVFAYQHGMRKKPKMRRACVHLTRTGDYDLHEHKNVRDLATFLAYLRIAAFEIENGLRPMPKERD